MHYSFFSRIRDMALVCALFFLVKLAFERTTSFINDHKKSFVHTLDRDFLDEIYTAQRQLHFLEHNYSHDEDVARAIADIKQRLATIEEKYKTNSPGVMLLGPIGSAAIVTKEEKLKQQLLNIVNDINNILRKIHNDEPCAPAATTISAALADNKHLLQQITTI